MSADERNPARAASIGRANSWFGHRVVAAGCFSSIPILPILAVNGAVESSWWVSVLASIGLALLLGVTGLWSWYAADDEKADTERLQLAGRPAVAEIVDKRLIDFHDGDVETAVLTLRIGGDDVPPFEAKYRLPESEAVRIGAQLTAVVDPSDNLFTLQPLKPSRYKGTLHARE